ncbi:MAG TPA: AAA family ATPase, partial [Pseudomonas sp.]|nr:AAA family ATPase [Pseudomonas sp.]
MNAPEFPTAAGASNAPFYQPQGNEQALFEQAWRHGMP